MLLLLTTACLFDTDNPLFIDADGDGVSVYQGDCVDNKKALQGPVVLNDTDYSTLGEAVAVAIPGDAVLIGLTLTGGIGTRYSGVRYGGGALLFDNVELDRVTVRDNLADSQGGGVVLVEANAVLSKGAIEGNTANNAGGGLLVAVSALSVDGTDFSLNSPEDLVLQSANGNNTVVAIPGNSFSCDSTTNSPSCQ